MLLTLGAIATFIVAVIVYCGARTRSQKERNLGRVSDNWLAAHRGSTTS